MPEPVTIEDQGDGWWEGPSALLCEVCWEESAALDGTLSRGRYWLLKLSVPMRHRRRMCEFEYVLVPDDQLDLAADRAVDSGGHPMYPVLRRPSPGDCVSFDGELLDGIKATIRRP